MPDERGLPPNEPGRPDLEIPPQEVAEKLAADDRFVLVDCRTPREHNIAAIDGAVLLPLQQLQHAVEELADDKQRPIVVFCHHGVRSLRMTAALIEAGFTDVRSMAGGIDRWSMLVDPTVPRY